MQPKSLAVIRSCWKPLLAADVLFKLIAYVLLTPVVSLLFHLFLSLSGRTILADMDILLFLLHPTGWAMLLIVGGGLLAILAIEHAVLLAILISHREGKSVSVLPALAFVAGRTQRVYRLTARVVMWMSLAAAPLLALGGGLFFALLTKHDINFYLKHRPSEFWLAAGLIGVVLVVLGVVWGTMVARWCIALPMLLFEGKSPRDGLAGSSARTAGHRWRIARWLAGWALGNLLLSVVLTSAVVLLARLIVADFLHSIWWLTFVVGVIISLWSLVNMLTAAIFNISLAALVLEVYELQRTPAAIHLPEGVIAKSLYAARLTRLRLLAAAAICLLVATLIGAVAIHGVELEDRVEVSAHRGGAAHAPENTLAAIRQAIEDKADWVEIDVQESKDGIVLVTHDSDLKRTTGRDVKIWDATADELRAIDIGSYFDPKFSGERVPTLDEVLQLCRGRVKVNIELKYYGRQQQLEQRVVDLVETHGMQDEVVFMSLEQAGIRRLKQLRPRWRAGLLVARSIGDPTRTDADFLAVNRSIATPQLIRQVHAQGKQIFAWTANDAATLSALIGRGIDNVITDDPRLARRILDERDDMSPVERVLVELGLWLGASPQQQAPE